MISVTIDLPSGVDIPTWNGLSAHATPNAFMNPAALRVAQELGFSDVRVLRAWDERGALAGLWALQMRRALPLWPAVLETLPYYYAFQSAPVIDPARSDEVMAAFLTAIRDEPSLPNVVSIQDCDCEGPAYAALARQIEGAGYAFVRLGEQARPVIARDFGAKTGGSTRKRLRQAWNRLSALGVVEIVNERDPARIGPEIETFLALEAGGWKGENGTALLSRLADAAFARAFISRLCAAGAASVISLRLDGKHLASQVL